MSVLESIAFYQNRRDEIPNQELARDLALSEDRQAIQEIADNLQNTNQNVQSDCLKVLYEIGYLKPELAAPYAADFLKLLRSKNNRLVWGSMIALSTIAELNPDPIDSQYDSLLRSIDEGTVITRDAGIKVLAQLAASSPARSERIFPYLLEHLQTCRPKDIPQRAETILQAVEAVNSKAFIEILERRLDDLTGAQIKRVRKVIRLAEKLTGSA